MGFAKLIQQTKELTTEFNGLANAIAKASSTTTSDFSIGGPPIMRTGDRANYIDNGAGARVDFARTRVRRTGLI